MYAGGAFTNIGGNGVHYNFAGLSITSFDISASAVGYGAISPSGNVIVAPGSDRSFVFAPYPHWHTDSLVVDGDPADSLDRYTFYGITGHHSISAFFKPDSQFATLPMSPGWNLVSIPVVPANFGRSKIFYSTISPAFTYLGQYVVRETLAIGTGYWLSFGVVPPVYIVGSTVASETISVKRGWNMIGSITSPVPVNDITSIPPGAITSNFFGYNSGNYVVADTIVPGHGYWVKLTQESKLILDCSGSSATIAGAIQRLLNDTPPPPPNLHLGQESGIGLPSKFLVRQNYPNPFNPTTTFRYELPADSHVSLRIYNVLGQEVKRLVDEIQTAGYKSVPWDASSLPSGVYIYRLEANPLDSGQGKKFTDTKKMILLK